MAGSKGYILVEGHGEVEAAHNLIIRLSEELGLYIPWAPPLRWKNLHQWESPRHGGVRRGAEFARAQQDIGALLVLRDEDDGCPAELAPAMSERIRSLALPFPVSFVLLRPEYEVLFLPCLGRMTSLGFPPGLVWDRQSWESKRDIKGWLSDQLPVGRSYKPTISQLPMARLIDFATIREAEVPSFGSLERGIAFLAEHLESAGVVYPPAPLQSGV